MGRADVCTGDPPLTTTALSLRGLARLMGVSEKAVRNALAAGVFSDASVRRDETGGPEVLDATLAVAEWQRSGRQLRGTERRAAPPAVTPLLPAAGASDGRPVSPGTPTEEIEALLARVRSLRQDLAASGAPLLLSDEEGGAAVPSSLVAAQREAILERGRKLRLENDVREGLLLEADVMARKAFEFARVLRETILNVPARISAELAAESDASRVFLRLDGALREALEATAATLGAAAAEGRECS